MLCISTADLPRGSLWQSPLYRGRVSELLPWGVTLPQLPAAWLNLEKRIILIFTGSKKGEWGNGLNLINWEHLWHAWKGRRMESKAVGFILSPTSVLQLCYRILAFSYRSCVISSRLISMTFLYLIYYLIAHDELHELSKTQSAITVRSLFKFPLLTLAWLTQLL